MKNLLSIFTFVLILNTGFSQVIPDLLLTDNYRPYLTEQQLQQDILNNTKKEGYPRTSQQLYPELYKYANSGQPKQKNDPFELTPSIPDPTKVTPNYAQSSAFSPSPSPSYRGQPSERNKQQLAQYEKDRAEQLEALASQRKVIEEADKAYKSIPRIQYDLGQHEGKAVEGFENAYSEIRQMLSGQKDIDFIKVIFLLESAYDQSLTWEEFSTMFNSSLTIIQRLMIQDGLDPKDNMAKIMSIFKFMADTTEVYFPEKEKPVISKPMLYDYEDYAAKKDASKIFVSKLLRTGTGQCMSLPMLYFLYAQALEVENVHMALAPQHSFIIFKDKLENRHNIELTGRAFTTDDFQWQGGFVKAPQVKSKIYLNPLTEQETLAYILTTLSLTYIKSFGNDNRAYDMALTAKQYFPNSLTANMIIGGYFQDVCQNIKRQYAVHNLSQEQFSNDKKAQAMNEARNEAFKHIYDNLGYEKIPDWHYKIWLESVNEAARRKQHIVKRRQLEQQLNR